MNKKILKLAVPNILSNISIPLLSTVDVALMGQLSILHLGAIGLAAMIFNFFFWNFGFLRMGTTGLVAQAYGADNSDEIQQILSKSIYISLLIAGILLLFQYPIGYIAMHLLGISSEHSSLVWQYFNIRIWSAPATMLTYSLFGWFFGMQNSIIPMISTLVINVMNIVLSYLLVMEYNLGINGVAYGTVIAEYSGVFILIAVLRSKYDMRLLPLKVLMGWKKFLRVNSDLFIRTVALTSAFAFFYRQSTMAGELILATNVVMLQFLSWMSYGIDGFAYASESLVGRYVGKNQRSELLKVVKLSFKWGLVLATSFSITYAIFSQELSGMFTSEKSVLEMIITYRYWLSILPLVAFWSYIWDGIFIGLTRTKMMRISMLYSLLIYLVVFKLLQGHFENAIWMAFLIFLFARGSFLTFYWFKNRDAFLPVVEPK